MTPRRIDLARLSPKQMLDLAVTMEQEARQRYRDLADQMRLHQNGEAAEFFQRLADLTSGVLDELRQLRTVRFDEEPATFGQSVPELGELEESQPEYRRMRSMLTIHRALDVAVEAGRAAHSLYDEAAREASGDELRSLFEQLRADKDRQRRLIEQFRSTLPEAEPTDADSDADVAAGRDDEEIS